MGLQEPETKLLGGIGGCSTPSMIKKEDLAGDIFGSSFISRAILESFIYVALVLLLFAPAKYYVVHGK